jgi:hypothetical protein
MARSQTPPTPPSVEPLPGYRVVVLYAEIASRRHGVRDSRKFIQISPTTRKLRHIDFEDPGQHLGPRVVEWGYNAYGQLGDNSVTNRQFLQYV